MSLLFFTKTELKTRGSAPGQVPISTSTENFPTLSNLIYSSSRLTLALSSCSLYATISQQPELCTPNTRSTRASKVPNKKANDPTSKWARIKRSRGCHQIRPIIWYVICNMKNIENCISISYSFPRVHITLFTEIKYLRQNSFPYSTETTNQCIRNDFGLQG